MLLEGKLLTAAISDIFVFLIELIIFFVIVIKRHKDFERYFLIFYGFVSLSAYNIYIQFIHDYNIPIARTALFKLKIIGSLYLFDIVYLIVLLVLLIKYSRYRKIRLDKGQKINLMIFFRDILLLLFSFLGYFIYVNSGYSGDIVTQIRPLRGFLFSIVIIWLFFILINKIQSLEQAKRIIVTIAIIDFINIIGEALSSHLFDEYVWQRGWHNVLLIDQANSMAVLYYIPLIIFYKKFGKFVALIGFLFLSLMIYDYVKGLYIGLPLIFFIYFMAGVLNNKINIKTLFFIIIMAPFALWLILNTLESKAISGTRTAQVQSYLHEINGNIYPHIFGSGFGGMYEKIIETDDGGEIKKIDLESTTHNKQVQFQVPFIYYFKIAGFIGLTVVVIFAFYQTFLILKLYNIDKMVSLYLVISFIVELLDPPFVTVSGDTVLFYEKLLFMVMLLMKLKKLELKMGGTS